MRSVGIFAVLVAACAAHSSAVGGGGGGGYSGGGAPAPPDPIVGAWVGDWTGRAEADASGNVTLHLSDGAPECAQSAPDAVEQCSHGTWTNTGGGTYAFTVRDFDLTNCSCGGTLSYTGTLSGNTVTIGDDDDTFTRQ
jgi:hypothetical protein